MSEQPFVIFDEPFEDPTEIQHHHRRQPVDDITNYAEPVSWTAPEFLTTPGVTSAWFLLDGEYLPVAIMTMGDGKGNVMRRDR